MQERIAIAVRCGHQFPIVWSGEGFRALRTGGEDATREFIWVVVESGFAPSLPPGEGIWVCEGDFKVSTYQSQDGEINPIITITNWAWRYPDGYELLQFALGRSPWDGPQWGAGPVVRAEDAVQLSMPLGVQP